MAVRLTVSMILAAIALTGCGGHSRSRPSAYRSHIGRICSASNDEMEAHQVSDQKTEIRRLALLQKAALAQVRAVTPPTPIRSQVDSWLRSADQATNVLGKWSTNLADSRSQLLYGELAVQAQQKAEALGLGSCTRNGVI